MTKYKSDEMSLSKCLKAYKLFVKHEKDNLIVIDSIGINEVKDRTKIVQYGQNRGKLMDNSTFKFFVNYNNKEGNNVKLKSMG